MAKNLLEELNKMRKLNWSVPYEFTKEQDEIILAARSGFAVVSYPDLVAFFEAQGWKGVTLSRLQHRHKVLMAQQCVKDIKKGKKTK